MIMEDNVGCMKKAVEKDADRNHTGEILDTSTF
jgi:hypothetical protein